MAEGVSIFYILDTSFLSGQDTIKPWKTTRMTAHLWWGLRTMWPRLGWKAILNTGTNTTTTNAVEGWHHKNAMCRRPHPNICLFILTLQQEQAANGRRWFNWMLGYCEIKEKKILSTRPAHSTFEGQSTPECYYINGICRCCLQPPASAVISKSRCDKL